MRRIIVEVQEKKGTETAESMAAAMKKMLGILGYTNVIVHTEAGPDPEDVLCMETRKEIEILPFTNERRRCSYGR